MLSDNRWQGPEQVSWVKLQDAFLAEKGEWEVGEWKRRDGFSRGGIQVQRNGDSVLG